MVCLTWWQLVVLIIIADLFADTSKWLTDRLTDRGRITLGLLVLAAALVFAFLHRGTP